ncbi:PA14 domain-containing protein, partial [Acinetobacter baumannii]
QARSTGLYKITTNSDDGVQVWINNVLVIDNYNYHAPTLDSATVSLTAGVKVPIKIKFVQGSGGSVLQLFWQSIGIPQQIVPSTQLYPE